MEIRTETRPNGDQIERFELEYGNKTYQIENLIRHIPVRKVARRTESSIIYRNGHPVIQLTRCIRPGETPEELIKLLGPELTVRDMPQWFDQSHSRELDLSTAIVSGRAFVINIDQQELDSYVSFLDSANQVRRSAGQPELELWPILEALQGRKLNDEPYCPDGYR